MISRRQPHVKNHCGPGGCILRTACLFTLLLQHTSFGTTSYNNLRELQILTRAHCLSTNMAWCCQNIMSPDKCWGQGWFETEQLCCHWLVFRHIFFCFEKISSNDFEIILAPHRKRLPPNQNLGIAGFTIPSRSENSVLKWIPHASKFHHEINLVLGAFCLFLII